MCFLQLLYSMPLIYFLLISEAVGLVLFQPQDVHFVAIGDSAQISCITNASLILADKGKFSWYWRTWRNTDTVVEAASCVDDHTKKWRHVCEKTAKGSILKLRNLQPEDSGIYYCTYLENARLFANGTVLIIGALPRPRTSSITLPSLETFCRGLIEAPDSATSKTSVYLLALISHNTSNIHLACIVHTPRPIVHVTWNISETHHKGTMMSINDTWNFQNVLLLSKDTWDHGDHVTCKVWFSSTPTQIHWRIPEKDNVPEELVSLCSVWLMITLPMVLLLCGAISVHLFWTYKKSTRKRQYCLYRAESS
ncbi:uncharacterized protein [Hyperolius riggenbachi]|uniref:uncharacterized protein isoform X2 n=1 Tax=Hyperolius riggenbachi TaxID=752182 RepID=UPI0035A2FAA4